MKNDDNSQGLRLEVNFLPIFCFKRTWPSSDIQSNESIAFFFLKNFQPLQNCILHTILCVAYVWIGVVVDHEDFCLRTCIDACRNILLDK